MFQKTDMEANSQTQEVKGEERNTAWGQRQVMGTGHEDK
jgi:hypothetical protein